MEFEEAFGRLGFRAAEERVTREARLYRFDPNAYLNAQPSRPAAAGRPRAPAIAQGP